MRQNRVARSINEQWPEVERYFYTKAFTSQHGIHHAVFPGTKNPEASLRRSYQRKEAVWNVESLHKVLPWRNSWTLSRFAQVRNFYVRCLWDSGIVYCCSFPCCCCCCWVASVVSDSVRPHRRQPTRLPRPWDSPGKNTGVGCHFLLQCMKVKSESEVAQSCPTLHNPMDCSLPGFSIHGIFQARVLEWDAITFSGSIP